LDRRFLDEVDPDRVLPEAERRRRAESARKVYYQRLALASAKARARRKAVIVEAEAAAAELVGGGDAA
jgi:hypothetical protein